MSDDLLTPELSARLAKLSPASRAALEQALVRRSRSRSGGGHAVPPAGRPAGDSAPLSFAQRRLWFLDRWQSDTALYGLRAALHCVGPVDISALRKALSAVMARHEILRTTFADVDGQPVQRVAPGVGAVLQVVDLRALRPRDRELALDEVLSAEARRPFDLARGPLIRARVVRLAETEAVLALSLHHIVADGWSYALLAREVSAAYTAFTEGRPVVLPDLPMQYADYATRQQQDFDTEDLRAGVEWWRGRLADLPEPLALPTDRKRPAVPSYRGATVRTAVPADVAAALRALSRREGATLFMTLLAGFQALLRRHTGQTDVVVGTPVAGRATSDVEELIGCFINTLALRTDIGGDPTFAELLGRVRDGAIAAYAHQDVPFELLVDRLRIPRSTSHTPVFQVLFALQNTPEPRWRLPRVSVRTLPAVNPAVHFDLAMTIDDGLDGLVVALDYSTDLFDAATASRLLEHYLVLLSAMAAEPERRVGDVRLLSSEEARQVLVEWNDTRCEPGAETDLVRLFEAAVRRTPDQVAVLSGDRRLTYADLNRRANQVAHLLREYGVRPETPVGLCGEWSVELVAALWGTLKSGGVFVPMDHTYPAERLARMRADAGVKIVLTERSLRDVHGEATVICVDEESGELARQPSADPDPTAAGANLAYIVFTSGSTGRPKGVGVTRDALVNYCAAIRRTIADDGQDLSFGFLAAPGTDLGYTSLFPPLLFGGRLTLLSRDCAFDGRVFAAAVAQTPIDVLKTTPTQLGVLLGRAEPAQVMPARWLILGGESVSSALAEQLSAVPGTRLLIHYGPTEATVGCVASAVERDAIGRGSTQPIGRPLANTMVYVLDARLRPVPVGVAGELCIAGGQLARGYVGRPDLTAERFVPDPFSPVGGRLYRTGDLVRWTGQGVLEFLGRQDRQLKIRGHRIEPGEIETTLLEHPSVSAAAVTVWEPEAGDARLVAYVVGAGPQEVRDFAAERLPAYMVPAFVVPLRALPLTANGKLDRAALPTPAADEGGAATTARDEPVAELLHTIWCEVLRVDRLAPDADFFAAGGHSLLVTQVLARVRRVFGVDLSVRALFDAPTLTGFTRRVEKALRAWSAPPAAPIRPAPRSGPIPLSHAQRRLWYLEQLDPGSPAQNVATVYDIEGPLRVGSLRYAVDTLRAEHESLRTVFRQTRGVPEQVVTQDEVPLPVIDLCGLGAAEAQSVAARLVDAETRRGFDLSTGPLLRVTLIRQAADRHVLAVLLHHIVTDAWSSELLHTRLWELYGTGPAGRPAAEPASLQYPDYAIWEQRTMKGTVPADVESYWRGQLAGMPETLDLALDRTPPMTATFPAATVPFELSEAQTGAAVEISAGHGVTPFMTVLTAYLVLLHRRALATDIVVGTDVANRGSLETERLIGFFTNQLALRVQVTGADQLGGLLERVRETTLGAYAHQEMPFDILVEMLRPRRHLNRGPLFQAEITYQRSEDRPPQPPGLRISPRSVHAPTTTLDLSLHVVHTETRLRGGLTYNADVFSAATARRMLGQLRALLDTVPADPGVRVDAWAARAEERERADAARERAQAARALFDGTGLNSAAAAGRIEGR